MVSLKNILLGSPEERKRKAKLKKKEQAAYWVGYSKGRVERARERGYQKGKGTSTSVLGKIQKGLTSVQGGLEGMQRGGTRYMEFLGLVEPTKRRKKRRKR
jgi:hypothetical protein